MLNPVNKAICRTFLCALAFTSFAGAQIVERSRTLADLLQSHPCNSGLAGRHTIVTDCDAADDLGNGGGAFSCFARCDGVDTWAAVSIGGGAGGGLSDDDYGDVAVSGSGTAMTVEALRGGAVTVAATTGNLQWEGTTADAFEGNFTFVDPTADWTVTYTSTGSLQIPRGQSFGDSHNFFSTGASGRYIEVLLNQGSAFAFDGLAPFASGNTISLGARSNAQFTWYASFFGDNLDTGMGRLSAGVVKGTDGGTGIRWLQGGGAAVASATALPVPTGRGFHVTGTTNITSMTATNLNAGVVVTLVFDGVLTFTDGNNLKLAGDFVTTADDTISLYFDGTNFYEQDRSIN